MQVKLTQKWSSALRDLPEDGMGYQLVDVSLRNGSIVKEVLVLNGEQMAWPDDTAPLKSDDIVEISISKTSRRIT